MTTIPGLRVTGTIVPTDTADTYPVTDPNYQIGGWREVATIDERNAIPVGRRRVGMRVYVVATDATWKLVGGLTNAHWVDTTVVGGLTSPHADFNNLPFRVVSTATGYRTDFDWEPPIADIPGTTYYVDPVTGNDANPGTDPALPLAGVRTAVLKPDRGRILIKGGTGYLFRTPGNTLDMDWGTAPISLEAWGGPVKFVNASLGSNYTWTSLGSGAYSATGTNVYGVLLTSSPDPLVPELPLLLTPRADVAALQAASEGFFISGSTINVKIPAGTTPGIATVGIMRNAGPQNYIGSRFYARGIHFLSWYSGFRFILVDNNSNARLTMVDCVVAHSDHVGELDAVGVKGVGLSAFKNCRIYYGGKDNLNFHRDMDAIPCYVLEEGCTSKYPGWRRAELRGPYQASTNHDGIVDVTVAPVSYGPTLGGPCVQDQGSPGYTCRRWIVGGTLDATGSPGTVGESGGIWGYPIVGGTDSETWVYDVTLTEGAAGPVKAIGPVYLRKTNMTLPPTGPVQPY